MSGDRAHAHWKLKKVRVVAILLKETNIREGGSAHPGCGGHQRFLRLRLLLLLFFFKAREDLVVVELRDYFGTIPEVCLLSLGFSGVSHGEVVASLGKAVYLARGRTRISFLVSYELLRK